MHKGQEKGFHCAALHFSEAQLVTAKQLRISVHYNCRDDSRMKCVM